MDSITLLNTRLMHSDSPDIIKKNIYLKNTEAMYLFVVITLKCSEVQLRTKFFDKVEHNRVSTL